MTHQPHREQYYESPGGAQARPPAVGQLQTLFELVTEATGVHLSFHDLSGVTYLIGSLGLAGPFRSHEVSFCLAAKRSTKAYRECIRCKYCSNYLAWKKRGPFLGRCHHGTGNLAWPVCFGERLLGVLYLGSVRFSARETFHRARRAHAEQLKLDASALQQPWDELPVRSEKQMWAYGRQMELCEAFLLSTVKASAISAEMVPQINIEHLRSQSQTSHWLLQQAKMQIHENFTFDLSLSTVAQSLHVRPQYLCRVFREEQGIPFTEYLHHFRVEKARQLFAEGARNVTEVGSRVGFNSPSYFSRVFTKVAGLSPRKFIQSLA